MAPPSNEALADAVPDDLFSLREATRRWPGRGGERMHISSVYRFALRGKAGIRLRTLKVPGVGVITCDKWIREWILAVARASAPVPIVAVPNSRRRLLRDSFLSESGI